MPEPIVIPHPEQLIALDIGGGLGSLIISTPAALCGREIEVSPQGAFEHRTHVGVWERHANGRRFFAAVFPPLDAGTYRVWGDAHGYPVTDIEVGDGVVAELLWE